MGDALVSIMPDMKRKTVDAFVRKAQELDASLIETKIAPVSLVSVGRNEEGCAEISSHETIKCMSERLLKKDDSICLDFGDHYVGYVSLKLNSAGSPQDAPAYLRLKFAEIPAEILDDSSDIMGGSARVGFRKNLYTLMSCHVN